jgi:nucleotide-binding universal stress UspA family protein
MAIICATDFSDSAQAAEARALMLARALAKPLVYLHVAVETPLYSEGLFSMADVQGVYEAQRRWAEDTLKARVAGAAAQGVVSRWVLRVGIAHEQIVQTAEDEKADMIVMGTHGRSGLNRLLMGSVAERVVRSARCPVLTVHPDA